MNIADLVLVPWPMFLLLIFLVGAWLWYINVYLPLVESFESLKKEESENIKYLKTEVSNLINSIVEIKKNVGQNQSDNLEIIKSLDNIEKFADVLNTASSQLNEKETELDQNITQINSKLNELTDTFNTLKNSIFTTNRKR